jgi:hypothetical protein
MKTPTPAVLAVGQTWRTCGAALVLIAAIGLVVAKALGDGLHSTAMIAGLAALARGWILLFVGVWLRMRHATRR